MRSYLGTPGSQLRTLISEIKCSSIKKAIVTIRSFKGTGFDIFCKNTRLKVQILPTYLKYINSKN